jgi:AraC family L-rhamnose operon regulatory protein RhaS
LFRREKAPLDESLSTALRTVELFWNDLRQSGEPLAAEWTVAGMARRCGMGVTHFIHQTKQLVNETPSQYLTRCRLDMAAKMLDSQSDSSITEVALRCGFGSSQYFATQFRRQFGRSPREFRCK